MKRAGLLAIGLGVYVVVLLVSSPATLIDAAVYDASNGRLRLTQAQGTIWAGNGKLEMRDAEGRNALARDIAWRIAPESLWRGKILCDVELTRTAQRFRVAASPGKVEVANAEISLPASTLAFAEARLKPLRLSGDLLLQASNLTIAQKAFQGNVTLRWNGAGSAFSPVSPLGSYEFQLHGQGNAVNATLTTLQGPMQLDGSGSWIAGGNPQFRATMLVPPEYREQMAPLLRLISVQREEGNFELELK